VLVEALEARDFRNLTEVLVEPHPRFNVIAGPNGQGKTNLIEAVYLLGTLRSFRAGRTDELLRFGCATARVRARVERLGLHRLLEVELRPGQKLARVDGKSARAAQYFGGFNVVLFASDDLRLPRGSPTARRRFLDRAVFNASPQYLEEAQKYERVLKSRNAVLRAPGARPELLEVYDQQLCEAAVPLYVRRRSMILALAPRVQETYRVVTAGLSLTMEYVSRVSGDSDEDLKAELASKLREDARKDLARGATSSGPHTDDIGFVLEGRDAGTFGSQGQLRALVLSLKISEIEQLTATLGDAPVLLLDDVSSELDAQRNLQLFSHLQERLETLGCQVFITTTHPDFVHLRQDPLLRRDFNVLEGRLFQ